MQKLRGKAGLLAPPRHILLSIHSFIHLFINSKLRDYAPSQCSFRESNFYVYPPTLHKKLCMEADTLPKIWLEKGLLPSKPTVCIRGGNVAGCEQRHCAAWLIFLLNILHLSQLIYGFYLKVLFLYILNIEFNSC